jgi:hypothetical protein
MNRRPSCVGGNDDGAVAYADSALDIDHWDRNCHQNRVRCVHYVARCVERLEAGQIKNLEPVLFCLPLRTRQTL